MKVNRKWIAGEYWTLYPHGGQMMICSVHRSAVAADRAARKCEKAGGFKHRIVHVSECGR